MLPYDNAFFNHTMNHIKEEIILAKQKYPGSFNSSHEAFAILKEEVDELWDEVKSNKSEGTVGRQAQELVQIMAMAYCYLEDLSQARLRDS